LQRDHAVRLFRHFGRDGEAKAIRPWYWWQRSAGSTPVERHRREISFEQQALVYLELSAARNSVSSVQLPSKRSPLMKNVCVPLAPERMAFVTSFCTRSAGAPSARSCRAPPDLGGVW